MASGNNRNGNISSLFSPANLCLLVGAGYGLASLRLSSRADSLKSQLASAPEISLSSLTNNCYPNGQLVFLQNGVVSPLEKPLISSSRREAVAIKTVEKTDQPPEFEHLYKGTQNVTVSSVPFALVDPNENSRCVVVEAGIDFLPLREEASVKSALDPPLYLSKKKKLSEIGEEKIRVNIVRQENILRARSTMNVFGILTTSHREGRVFATIKPCPGFPKGTFTETSRGWIGWMLFPSSLRSMCCAVCCGVASLGSLTAALACLYGPP